MATNGATNGSSQPEIILYTNHGCPWAHRAHIALKELELPYKEEIIDLERPRDPWYLKVNPRGLVPSIKYNGEIITESAIVSQFLVDAHPSHLLPPSNSDPLLRARMNFFADTFTSKVIPRMFVGMRAQTEGEKDAQAEELVKVLTKEMEPLFDWDRKGPFYGGSEKLTIVEVLTGSFLLRLLGHAKPEYGITSTKLLPLIAERAPKFNAWAEKVVEHNSVNFIWDEKNVAEKTKARFAKMAAEKKI